MNNDLVINLGVSMISSETREGMTTHYNDVVKGAIASQITILTIVY